MSDTVKIWIARPPLGWAFVGMWIAANMLAALAALAAFTASGIAIIDAILPDPAAAGEASGYAGLFGLVIAVLVTLPVTALVAGLLQWLVLRWFVPWAGRWMVATFFGLILGMAAGISVGRGALGYGITGAMMGIAQWLVIRRPINKAYWWMPACAFGLFFGGLLSPNRLVFSGVVVTGLSQITIQLLIPVVFWAILSGITLRFLSRQSAPAM